MTATAKFRVARRYRLIRNLCTDKRGNVLMIFGLAIIPLTFATGMGIDYGHAMQLQTQLNAAADAAALMAVGQQEMSWTADDAQAQAVKMFKAQTKGLPGLVINYNKAAQFNVTVVDTPGATNSRTATVTYRAQSTNSFGAVLGWNTLTIQGTSSTNATEAPNIDFYMLLDVSGSMALPTTSAGIAIMKASNSEGCAFACHNTNYSPQGTAKNGTKTDYYGVARSYSIPLRVDAEGKATNDLSTVALSTASANNASYRMAVASFAEATKSNFAGTFTKMQALTTDLSAAGAKAATAQVSQYYANSMPTSSRNNNDTDSGFSDAFIQMNTWMPAPGGGSHKSGDTPQEIMFVITDGMRDELRADGKPEVAIDTTKCDAIKSRGIRIAILYTEYLPETINNNSWSTDPGQGNVLARLPQIEPALQSCASSGLYYKVSTDDDISAALNSLFQKAVATAHIIT